jgi:hypothetical protein
LLLTEKWQNGGLYSAYYDQSGNDIDKNNVEVVKKTLYETENVDCGIVVKTLFR